MSQNRSNNNQKNRSQHKGKPNARPKKPVNKEAGLDATGRNNDPNWYFSSSELANQAAQLSFQDILGQGTIYREVKAPTIMRIDLNPSPGISYAVPAVYSGRTEWLPDVDEIDDNDGINLCAQKIYTMLSATTGRTTQYQPQDVANMILAIGEVASLSEHIRRAFGVAFLGNPRNRMLPLKLLESMSLDANDLISNYSDYRMRFNVEISRINQIPLLDNIAYIRKCRDIYQHLYVDSPSIMAQIFYYAPSSTWYLEEQDEPTGTYLNTVRIMNNTGNLLMKMSNLISMLRTMIDKLLNSTTMQWIYMDLLNMANRNSVRTWMFDYLGENFIVAPEYNVTALIQLHNLDIIGNPLAYSEWDSVDFVDSSLGTFSDYHFTNSNNVYGNPDTNRVVYNPLFAGCAFEDEGTPHIMYPTVNRVDTLVDLPSDNPSIEDKIEALRFSLATSPYGFTLKYGDNDGFGYAMPYVSLTDHYAVRALLFENDTAKPRYIRNNTFTEWSEWTTSEDDIGHVLSEIEKFNYHFFMYKKAGADVGSTDGLFGDINFFTTVDWYYLVRLNRIIFTGLFEYRT